jgi:O-antigen/teichoic acid export membrane protein
VLEILMSWLVPFFFGSAFEPSVPVARIMLIGAFCFSLRRVISDALRGANRPLAGTIAEAVAWAFYGALVVPMTIAWEAKGAAAAIAIAAAASLMFIAFSARRASLQLPATEVVTVPPAPQPS